jgi:hypothetical protein
MRTRRGTGLQVVARHAAGYLGGGAVGDFGCTITVLRSDSCGSSPPCTSCGPDAADARWCGGDPGGGACAANGAVGGGAVRLECVFDEGVGQVLVEAAPPKSAARMREKKRKYGPPHPGARRPLSANILDPVRASVVCTGASQLLQVRRLSWAQEILA